MRAVLTSLLVVASASLVQAQTHEQELDTPELPPGQQEGFDPENPEASAEHSETHSLLDVGATPEEVEEEKPALWHIGGRGRLFWVPAFMQELFLDKAINVVQPGFSIVATRRDQDGFNLVFGLGYTSYAVEGAYRARGDPPQDQDTEYIDSSLKVVHATVALLWETAIGEMFAFEYGFGADLGIIFDNLVRTEAHLDGGQWRRCDGPLMPSTTADNGRVYCDDDNGEHYFVEEERVPPIMLFPSLPHLALRFQPDPRFMAKLEGGFGLAQFWIGLSAHYGIE